MRPRFHLPELDPSAGHGVLPGEEATHLTRVLRLGLGADIDVFDGRGGMFHARVSAIARTRVQVDLLEAVTPAPEPVVHVTLGMCVLKGDKMDDVIRDVTMMGVAVVQPLVSTRTEVTRAALSRGHRAERWTRIAASSVKQCGRAVLPDIRPPADLAGWLSSSARPLTLVLAEPSAGVGRALSQVPAAPSVCILVGPEGGWTPEERLAFTQAGAVFIALGGRTLRADAAPVVAMAALFEAWGVW